MSDHSASEHDAVFLHSILGVRNGQFQLEILVAEQFRIGITTRRRYARHLRLEAVRILFKRREGRQGGELRNR